ncbi:Dynein heavy chain 3, axonemal [Portunus trituberculatus]|uniref:Dynein heavy chain 3, axonemal n=1 Tax=Portunus trituberculatus TaxID=210409 RepID=A0A5B7FMM3_PORTR|nr:Dynein heavy chain 3, axonemal [Portunus trituberculatus]
MRHKKRGAPTYWPTAELSGSVQFEISSGAQFENADLISQEFGEEYLSTPQFDICSSFGDSTCHSPLIFILSPGSDPIGALCRFAQEREMDEADIQIISLGQGQK